MKNEREPQAPEYQQNPLKTASPLPIAVNRAYIRRVSAS